MHIDVCSMHVRQLYVFQALCLLHAFVCKCIMPCMVASSYWLLSVHVCTHAMICAWACCRCVPHGAHNMLWYAYACSCVHACMHACVLRYMYACVYVCMCVCMHVCMHALCSMHVCMDVWMCLCMHVCMDACMCMCVCRNVCMQACMPVSMQVCMHVPVY